MKITLILNEDIAAVLFNGIVVDQWTEINESFH